MVAESTPSAGDDRALPLGAVAARFLTRIECVRAWIDEGRLRAETDASGRVRVRESALLEFQEQAYRRENFPGLDHGIHSWPSEQLQGSNLPVPIENAGAGEAQAARWPFPHA